MTGYIKRFHTGIFTRLMGYGKTHLVLDLIENEYKTHFDYIIIDVLTDDELVVVRSILKSSEHACLYICNEFPCGFKLLNHV